MLTGPRSGERGYPLGRRSGERGYELVAAFARTRGNPAPTLFSGFAWRPKTIGVGGRDATVPGVPVMRGEPRGPGGNNSPGPGSYFRSRPPPRSPTQAAWGSRSG